MTQSENTEKLFICGGCNAKIGPGNLHKLLENLPATSNENLLVGFDATDDAAVMKLTDDLALIQTVDFFPTMVSDPYLFGKIAATNALSDVYAMGGEVVSALNIVCFPEEMDLNILGDILRGGAEKVQEAGGVLAGGHSIHDKTPKYGLAVSGTIHPDKILKNNTGKVGDHLILTKPLGVGIITTAYSVGETSETAFNAAVENMTTLNKYAAAIMKKYPVTSCTDVTGFGLLGHLTEMLHDKYSANIFVEQLPYIEAAYTCAKEFLVTAGGQRNRNYLEDDIVFEQDDFAMEEILFDPQTSGGLLISVPADQAENLLNELLENQIPAADIGEIIPQQAKKIYVK